MTLELHYPQQLISFSAPLREPSQCKNIFIPSSAIGAYIFHWKQQFLHHTKKVISIWLGCS